MTKLLTLSAAVLLAAAISLTPAIAAESPQGLTCPTKTMDGKWVKGTNVNKDCVAQSIYG
ncbi:hypothetical protein [Devosia sp.]|uniref:hypothetical protein n=1 Tax=Devosia sp. TaxID=1871048 RepID=UPI0025F1884C|nr:hypothetical protein [Devosia sp.]MCR6633790.1 hypothetical protein [Devosia sp.]